MAQGNELGHHARCRFRRSYRFHELDPVVFFKVVHTSRLAQIPFILSRLSFQIRPDVPQL